MTDHLGESAALYALGALDDRERLEVERHLEQCDACRRFLAQAEADVTAIETSREQLEAPDALYERLAASIGTAAAAPAPAVRTRMRPWLAAAAAAVIALLPAGYLLQQNVAMHGAMTVDEQALARVAASPHRVARFSGMDANVMYASDGSWYCVVIRGARAGLQVVWPHDGVQTMLGTARAHGDVALLYLPKSHRMDRLTIQENGRVVGQAQLVF